MYDERLVRAAQEGDEAAFAALYDRAVDSVYDLCWSLTGDAAEAARLVETSFLIAARNLDQLSDPSQVRPWLLAIAGDQALADDQEGVLQSGWAPPVPAADDIEPLGNVALRRWVADAAAVLALADQLVLELQLRHDLNPDQLAAAVGVSTDQLPGVLDRVDAEARTVLGSLVLARQGRKHCAALAELLAGWDTSPSVDVADAVDAHAQTCAKCARRRRAVDPLELVAEAPVVTAPAALRTPVLDLVAAELSGGARPVAEGPRTQAVPVIVGEPPGRVPTRAVVGAAVVLAVLIGAVILALSLGSGKKSPAATSAATTAPTVATGPAPTLVPVDSSTTTSSTVVPGSVLTLNTARVNLGAQATTAQVQLGDTAATPTNWSAASNVPWLSVSPASGYLGAGQSLRVTLTINRTAAPQGAFDARVVFTGADQGSRSASVEVVGSNAPTTTTSSSTTTVPPTTTTNTTSTTVRTFP